MNDETVRYETSDHVATISLNRPATHNALTDEMFDRILEGCRRASADDDIKCIVLRGNGKSFSSGFDLSNPDDFYGGAERKGARFAHRKLKYRAELMRDILYTDKPTIAKVHGNCIGAGLYLVLVCNFAIAAGDAVFGLPEERFGSAGTTWLYPFVAAQCGLKKANELVMTGRKFHANEAAQLNLVNRAVPKAELESAVAELARAICSIPREGIASSRGVAHMSYDVLGYPGMFTLHYGMHPRVVMMERGGDEFDFRRRVAEIGLKNALRERDEIYSGAYWGW